MAMFEVDREALIERIKEVKTQAIAKYENQLSEYKKWKVDWLAAAQFAIDHTDIGLDNGDMRGYRDTDAISYVRVRVDAPWLHFPREPNLAKYDRDLKLIEMTTKETIRIKVEDFGEYI